MGYIVVREDGSKSWHKFYEEAKREFDTWKQGDKDYTTPGAPLIAKPVKIIEGTFFDAM